GVEILPGKAAPVCPPAQVLQPNDLFEAPPAHDGFVIPAVNDSGHMRRLDDIEGQVIRMAIDHYDGHMSEVARRLGIGRSTLYRKLKELGLEPAEAELSAETVEPVQQVPS